MEWTPEQVAQLAPDEASARAGRELATPRKWVTLGTDDEVAWGECQGSGKSPYQVQIALAEPAFKCSCPSRKFPCKHGLALLFLRANERKLFTASARPAWLVEWLATRAERSEKRAEKRATAAQAPADPAAARERALERERKVTDGVAELRLWLDDLLRSGFAAARAQPDAYWQHMAARLVDQQAPGLARLVRRAESAASAADAWEERLAERLTALHLACEAWTRRAELDTALQATLRARTGFTVDTEAVLAEGEALRARWRVVGRALDEEDRLRVQRTWLVDEHGRSALVLAFAAGTQPLDATLVPGTELDADVVYAPGAWPQRAWIKTRHGDVRTTALPPPGVDVDALCAAHARALAADPWVEQSCARLADVVPLVRDGAFFARDAAARLVPLACRSDTGWQLVALAGGRPIALAGEFDGRALRPLASWSEHGFVEC